MKYTHALTPGTLIKRYKRFLADVTLDSGETITAYCPNTGRMTTCITPGWPIRLSYNPSPSRKYAYTWEMVHNGDCWIGINTARTNDLATEAIEQGKIAEIKGYRQLKREVRYGVNSRIDMLCSDPVRRTAKKRSGQCYVEVKNVTLLGEDGRNIFPDAITARGLKHLHELTAMVAEGHRAVVLFVVQRSDGTTFRPAHEVDPAYAEGFAEARAAGVEMLAYRAEVSPEESIIAEKLRIPATPPTHPSP